MGLELADSVILVGDFNLNRITFREFISAATIACRLSVQLPSR